MDYNPNNGLVMVIRYDGQPPIPLTWKGKRVDFYFDKNGFPVYITEKDHARVLCSQKKDRYRLYRSRSLDVQSPSSTGAMVWIKIVPYYYEERVLQIGEDPENQEAKYGKKVFWHEDAEERHVVQPTVEYLTGERLRIDSQAEATPKQLLSIITENTELKKLIAEQGEAIKALTATVEELKKPAVPVTATKGTGK